ncbi:MAG: hypothetical protein DRP63_09385 [Planctomycetota bacterium]|nr:MAG: hypothetical protein DRP63_09385 [Planctomycetota bacterium]
MRVAVWFLLLGVAVFAQQKTASNEDDLREALARRLMKSSVVVYATHTKVQRSPKSVVVTKSLVTLSGFLLDKQGHVVTVGHAVKGAVSVEVEKPDGSRVKAKVVGVDSWTNVGLLKIEGFVGCEPVGKGGKVVVGRRVVVVLSPLGLRNTVGFGHISGKRRTLVSRLGKAQRVYSGMLQLSLSPALADAGGLVADYEGRLVGMVASACLRPPMVEQMERLLSVLARRIDSFTHLAEKLLKDKGVEKRLKELREAARRLAFPERFFEGLPTVSVAFAVPVEQIEAAVKRITSSGSKKPWLGIGVRVLSETEKRQLRLRGGVKVLSVLPNSPAAKFGLKKHDVLLSIDGKETHNMEQLRRVLMSRRPGQTVTLTVFRQGKKVELKLTLGSR